MPRSRRSWQYIPLTDMANEEANTPSGKPEARGSKSWSGAARALRMLKGQPDQTFAVQQTAASGSSIDDSLHDESVKDLLPPQEDGLLHHYAPIDTYEGKHRYDPKARWSEEEEKKLIRIVKPPHYPNT